MNHYKISPTRPSPFKTVNRIKPELSWWVKIVTTQPYCIYYFGPFDSQAEAAVAQYGYIEDLIEEKAHGISIEIEQNQPKLLTISEENYSSRSEFIDNLRA